MRWLRNNREHPSPKTFRCLESIPVVRKFQPIDQQTGMVNQAKPGSRTQSPSPAQHRGAFRLGVKTKFRKTRGDPCGRHFLKCAARVERSGRACRAAIHPQISGTGGVSLAAPSGAPAAVQSRQCAAIVPCLIGVPRRSRHVPARGATAACSSCELPSRSVRHAFARHRSEPAEMDSSVPERWHASGAIR